MLAYTVQESLSESLSQLTDSMNSLLPTLNVPSVYPALPPWSLLDFFSGGFPDLEPRALPPPVSDPTLARPFNVSEETYLNALHISIPVAVCLAYVCTATNLNKVNRKRANKPWSFSKTSIFYVLVLLHNILLAAYSAWTFLGMVTTIRNTWPTGEGEHRVIRAVDALCKLHGPRGYGSAATFDPTSSSWSFTDRMMKLDHGAPDVTDVGRMWNEGLAFYGWLFYLSKFYEVFDTLIILAKGKNTSGFQTWHHAGAMFGTWAGIRYMSPPIWMFVMINAGIHTLMVNKTLRYKFIISLTLSSTRTTLSTILEFEFHKD